MNLITPPGSANIYGFAVNPQNENEVYYVGTIGNRSLFYKTVDGGKIGQPKSSFRTTADGFARAPKTNQRDLWA